MGATSVETAMNRTVAESLDSGRSGDTHEPGRDVEETLLELLT